VKEQLNAKKDGASTEKENGIDSRSKTPTKEFQRVKRELAEIKEKLATKEKEISSKVTPTRERTELNRVRRDLSEVKEKLAAKEKDARSRMPSKELKRVKKELKRVKEELSAVKKEQAANEKEEKMKTACEDTSELQRVKKDSLQRKARYKHLRLVHLSRNLK
jgi:cob(I)alamin adenosyltransferase